MIRVKVEEARILAGLKSDLEATTEGSSSSGGGGLRKKRQAANQAEV